MNEANRIDFLFMRGNVQNSSLCVPHVSSHDQLTDEQTKPLMCLLLDDLWNKIGVHSMHPLLRGYNKKNWQVKSFN